jgi:triosephosphate isomerase
VIAGGALQLGAQDVFWKDSGAYTGEVSAPMLRAVGCDWIIVGHSERRNILGESDEVVNRKLHAALRNELSVILAVGETAEERKAGKAFRVVQTQLRKSLAGVEPRQMDGIVVAYEPVWAIGTGDTATVEQVSEMHGTVRVILGALMGGAVAGTARIQYGGSVTAGNAAEILALPGVDGALVGGASLKANDFARIVQAAMGHEP